ncbi:unnamed protein product [Trichobilharzia szidati]|nr:unnamed protein product [Trichobilharzia szidati]
MTKDEMRNMASVKHELSPKLKSNKSSPVLSKLPASYSVESKRRSSSREHSSSRRRHKKRHSSRSSRRSSSRHHRSSSKRKRSHHSKHKHSSKKHHRDSHYRDRRSRHRHKHRRHSSTSTSSSSSDSSYDSRSRHRSSPDGKRITQASTTIPKDSNSRPRTENHVVTSTAPVISTTKVADVANSPAIPSQGVSTNTTLQKLTAQDILDKIQKHQQQQAKAQALAAAAAANLPKYYNPTTVNAVKLAEQQKKRKLLWSKKDNDNTNSDSKTLWATTSLIAGKGDSAAAAKFRKLMGIHDTTEETVDGNTLQADETEAIKRAEAQAELFRRLEHEYEMSRTITHTQRGAGLGFSSASHVDYSAYAAMQPDKDKNPNF